MSDKISYEDIPLHRKPRSQRLDEYAEQYKKYHDQLEKIKVSLEYLKEQILAEFSEDADDIELHLEDEGHLKITTPVKYDWDKSMLSEMFQGSELPECVSTNFTVSKRLYDAADVEVKQKLRRALTIKRGTTTIKVMKT